MKLRLHLSLRAALLACYAITAPMAMTLSAGALLTTMLAPQAQAAEDEASYDLGNVMYVGDSITHGTTSSSYRWAMHKIYADNGIDYNAVGKWSGCHSSSTAYNPSPDGYGGMAYDNVHSAVHGARTWQMSGAKYNSGNYGGTTVEKVLAETEETIDNFFLLAGTNDFLSDGTAGDAGFAGNMDKAYKVACDTQDNMATIVDAMLTDSPNANVTVLYVPSFTDEQGAINDAESYQAVALYNHMMNSWLSEQQSSKESWSQVSIVNTNRGLSDVTRAYESTYTTSDGTKITYTVDTMMHDDFTVSSGDAVHLSDQASLIVASNLAKANGYAGRTAGQTRLGSGELAVQLDAAAVSSSISNDGSFSYNWTEGDTLTNGYTLDLGLSLGDGATGGWNITDNLSITLSGAGLQGTLVLNEGYIMWDGKAFDNAGSNLDGNGDGFTMLYSYDMSDLDSIGNLRIAYVAADTANGLAGGYYVWLDDMLIGEALAGSDFTGDYAGITINYGGSGNLTITDVAVDGSAAYAPSTDGITNTEAAYQADYGYIAGNQGTIATDDWAAGVTQEAEGSLTTNLRGLSSAAGGDVSITATGGSMSSPVYANQGNYTGNVWVDVVAGGISNSNWYAAHNNGTLTGDAYLKFSGEATGTKGTVFGGVIGTVDGSVYLEFSAEEASFGTWSDEANTGQASVAGSYQTNISGDVTMVFNAGTFDYRIMGGVIYGNQTIGGSTHLYINGGTFAQDVIGGGLYGTIAGGANITITGGTIKGNIYGGNTGGSISGGTNLLIAGDASIAGNVYGGGTGGSVLGDSSVTINGYEDVSITGSIINAGDDTGTIAGNTSLNLEYISDDSNMANYAGTLSGGTVTGDSTRSLNFKNVMASAFAATITNFDKLGVDSSSLSLTGVGVTVDSTSLSNSTLTMATSTASNLGAVSGSGSDSVLSVAGEVAADSITAVGLSISDGSLTVSGASEAAGLSMTGGTASFKGGLTLTNTSVSLAAGSTLNLTGTTNMTSLAMGGAKVNLDSVTANDLLIQLSASATDTLHIAGSNNVLDGFSGANKSVTTGALNISMATSASASMDFSGNSTNKVTSDGVSVYAFRSDVNFTLATGSQLDIDAGIWIAGVTWDVSAAPDSSTGGGTLSVDRLLVGYSEAAGLNIGAGATLEVTGTTLASNAYTSAFTVGGSKNASSVTVNGTLELNSGIYRHGDGSGTVNVEKGGTIVMNDGLKAISASSSGALDVNVKAGATLALGNQSGNDTTDYGDEMNVNIASGATITDNGAAESTTVYHSLVYAQGASVNFVSSDFGQMLIFDKAVDHNVTANISGKGTVAFAGGATLQSATVEDGSTLSLNGAVRVADGVTLKGGTLCLEANSAVASDVTMSSGSRLAGSSYLVSAGSSGATITMGDAGSMSASSLSDVSLAGATVSVASTLSLSLSGVTIAADTHFSQAAGPRSFAAPADAAIIALSGDNALSASVEGGTLAIDGNNYTISTFSDDLAVSIDGSLDVTIVLSADELAAFNSAIWEDDAELSITLAGVESLVDDATLTFNIATVDGDISYSFTSDELDTSSGSLVIKATSDSIPEPSTATLSLLALAALLARRNKRAV